MKKLLALILACMFVLTALVSCGTEEDDKKKKKDEIKGAEIQMFLTTLPESLDPAAAYTTVDQMRIMGLLYEGLTTINEKGKLENALCKEYEYEFNKRTGNLDIMITLENSRWSDGNKVTADDFRFAWKRVLLPENDNANAALLYPILNAKKVKEGLCSEDDLGVYSLKNGLIQITLEKEYVNEDDFSKGQVKERVQQFMRRLASPALVPLREDVVDDVTKDWCKPNGTTYVTNGPFKIKSWNSGDITFERSVNYRCVGDSESNDADMIVKPYRLINLYSEGLNADHHLQRYQDEKCFYLNLNSASDETLAVFGKKIEKDDTLSSTVVYLDHSHELFANPKVRQALSLALDRTAMAAATNSEAATGFVPTGIEDAKVSADFRDKGGDLWSKSANMEAAKKLLEEAGVTKPGRYVIALEYSNLRADDEQLATLIKDAWGKEGLGFNINFSGKKQMYIDNKENGTYALNQNNESANKASAIIVNLQSMTTDAYSILTAFSGEYGGNIIDVKTKDVVYGKHKIGFQDEAYDELCDAFVNAENVKKATTAMHEAEKYLADQMPVIPLVFNKAYYVTQKLSGYELDGFGRLNFTELEQKNFKKYLKAAEEAAE